MEPGDLPRTPFFEAFTPDELKRMAPRLTRVRVRAGDLVFREGDPPGDVYAIERGRAEVHVRVQDQPLVLATLDAGDVFGEMSFIEDRPRSTTVRAAADLDLIGIPPSLLREVEEREPRAAARIYKLCLLQTSIRLRRSNDAIAGYYRERVDRLDQERREKELIYLLAHDLRSPLAIIEGGLTQLQDAKHGSISEKQARILKRSRRSSVFLRQLLEELLEIGRSEAGLTRAEPTTLRDVVLSAVPQCLARVDGPTLDEVDDIAGDYEGVRRSLARQDLHIDVPPDLLDVSFRTDRMRLVQVLMNLVGNALKYAPGWIAVRVRREGDRLRAAVVDRGPGLPEAYKRHIFERYRQVEAKEKGVQRGFGLGLAGAAELVKSLGGTIRAESGDGGVGTAMVFEVPFQAA